MNSILNGVQFHLAPMEGVFDSIARELWTREGDYERCTTEFLRVTNHVLSDESIFKSCPELLNNSKTASSTPVAVQLLGSDEIKMTENAQALVRLGCQHININFGCPSKSVFKHRGGSACLDSPILLKKIVSSIRKAVRNDISVSAKIRLGVKDENDVLRNCLILADAGVSEITVHCRTKEDGYRVPAKWHWIPLLKNELIKHGHKIDIIPNGDIWSLSDFEKCHQICQCQTYALGRGALVNPFLSNEIKMGSAEDLNKRLSEFIIKFFDAYKSHPHPKFALARTKQYLSFLKVRSERFSEGFMLLKSKNDLVSFDSELRKYFSVF